MIAGIEEDFNCSIVRKVSMQTIEKKYPEEIKNIQDNILKNATKCIFYHTVYFTYPHKYDKESMENADKDENLEIKNKINDLSKYFHCLGFTIEPVEMLDKEEGLMDGFKIIW